MVVVGDLIPQYESAFFSIGDGYIEYQSDGKTPRKRELTGMYSPLSLTAAQQISNVDMRALVKPYNSI